VGHMTISSASRVTHQNVPSDTAIALCLRRLSASAGPGTFLDFAAEKEEPDALARLMWLDSLPTSCAGDCLLS